MYASSNGSRFSLGNTNRCLRRCVPAMRGLRGLRWFSLWLLLAGLGNGSGVGGHPRPETLVLIKDELQTLIDVVRKVSAIGIHDVALQVLEDLFTQACVYRPFLGWQRRWRYQRCRHGASLM